MATYLASLGNVVSVRHKRAGIPVIESNAIGMLYGALCSLAVSAAEGLPLAYDGRWTYSAALIYLALFASVIGFRCFLTLVQRIGADKAAYSSVLFPVVALAVSTVYAGYRWRPLAGLGVALVLLGNVLALMRWPLLQRKPVPT